MKIATIYKWAKDPESASVRADGSVDWRGAKMTAGEDDPAALDGAKEIAKGANAQITGITIGDGDASWILARGVEQTISIGDAQSLTDQMATAKILAKAVQKLGDIDVVTIGDAQSYSGVPVALAGELGWSAIMGVNDAKFEDGKIIASRKVGSDIQEISLSTPVVLGFAAQGEEKKVPGMKEKLMARKRPTTKMSLTDIGATNDDNISSRGSRAPELKYAKLFDGEANEAVAKLIDALKSDGVL